MPESPAPVVTGNPASTATGRSAATATQRAASNLQLLHRQIHRLATDLAKAKNLDDACELLGGKLRHYFGCQQVAIGDTKRIRTVAGNGVFDPRSELARHLETVIAETNETRVAGDATAVDGSTATTAGRQRLCSMVGETDVVVYPLKDLRGDTTVTLVMWGFDQDSGPATAVHMLASTQAALTSALHFAHPAFVRNRNRSNGKRISRFWCCTAAIAIFVAAMFVPLTYKVKCDAVVQPSVYRYLAAPYEGRLEKTFVEPGDVVEKGDVLALMDGREIRWELAGLTADRDRAFKKRDSALAGGDTAAAQMASLEAERLELQIQLWEHRGKNLEIRTNISGVVVGGDLRKTEGARLQKGQTLFEIAPIDQMVLELEIPANDISQVEIGQDVNVRFDSYFGTPLIGRMTKIHPRAEIRDEKNTFIGEVMLDNPDGMLRPGEKGVARVLTDPHPLGWNLFHKPWQKLLVFAGW